MGPYLDTHGGSAHNPLSPSRLQIQAQPFLPLTLPEIRHLLVYLFFARPPNPRHVLSFSLWRRHHQAVAKFCHYKRNLLVDYNNLQL